jgi:hypothetical protein
MKRRQLLLKPLSSAALSLLLSACGATMKPDHPQVYQSFADRRPPKENIFLEQGNLSGLPKHRSSQFNSYTGRTIESKAQAEAEKSGQPTDFTNVKPQSQPQPKPGEQNSIQNENRSSANPSFWDRLKDKFSSLGTSTSPNSTAIAERKTPIENQIQLAQLQDEFIAQGSSNTYSYYDMADAIIPTSPTYSIKAEKLNGIMQIAAAPNNPSSPLVDVPTPESYDALKDEGKAKDKSELKNVPQTPKKKNDKTEVQPKPITEKPNQAQEITTPSQKSDQEHESINQKDNQALEHDNYKIIDTKAKVVLHGNQQVLMGSIGTLKTTM